MALHGKNAFVAHGWRCGCHARPTFSFSDVCDGSAVVPVRKVGAVKSRPCGCAEAAVKDLLRVPARRAATSAAPRRVCHARGARLCHPCVPPPHARVCATCSATTRVFHGNGGETRHPPGLPSEGDAIIDALGVDDELKAALISGRVLSAMQKSLKVMGTPSLLSPEPRGSAAQPRG